jgi:hypothetical protein
LGSHPSLALRPLALHDPTTAARHVEKGADVIREAVVSGGDDAGHDLLLRSRAIAQNEDGRGTLIELDRTGR